MQVSREEYITLLKKEFPNQDEGVYWRLAEGDEATDKVGELKSLLLLAGLLGATIGLLAGVLMTRYIIINLIAENAPQILPLVVKIISHGGI